MGPSSPCLFMFHISIQLGDIAELGSVSSGSRSTILAPSQPALARRESLERRPNGEFRKPQSAKEEESCCRRRKDVGDRLVECKQRWRKVAMHSSSSDGGCCPPIMVAGVPGAGGCCPRQWLSEFQALAAAVPGVGVAVPCDGGNSRMVDGIYASGTSFCEAEEEKNKEREKKKWKMEKEKMPHG
ncbi:unnamed protein product [Cuscuta europaea]|uniref:Uncharacterized protein n=1 Tax=Cuscuta europaea TaxID=41803 RepID=A0A9P1EMM7_CUSEU|nr:unnamed protein product [Cuscuta europaea]